jgi:hypothetical protein
MSELRPLHEECESELERALLSAGLAYGASQRTRDGTLAALGLHGKSSRRRHPRIFAFAAAAALVAVVSGGAVAGYRYQREWRTERLAALPVATFATPAAVPAAPHAAKPINAKPIEEAKEAEAPVATPSAAPPPVRSRERTAPSRVPLAGELAVLDAASASIAAGNSRRGLVLLDAYAKDYPRGRLGLEAEVLRMDALAQSGQADAAAKAAAKFVKRHPDSVLAVRVRRYLRD